MIDIKLLLHDFDSVALALSKKQVDPSSLQALSALATKLKHAKQSLESLQELQNKNSKLFGAQKAQKVDSSVLEPLRQELEANKQNIAREQEVVRALQEELESSLATIPNLPDSHTPEGADESANIELKRILTPREFDFTPKEHFELAEQNGWIDFAAGVKLAKSRFSVLRGQGALLSRALINFMIDSNRKAGFELVSTPVIVNNAMLFGTGQLPKFEDDMFKICGEEVDSRSEAQNLESTFENATTLSEQQGKKVDSRENAQSVEMLDEKTESAFDKKSQAAGFAMRKQGAAAVSLVNCSFQGAGEGIYLSGNEQARAAESTIYRAKPTPKTQKVDSRGKQKGHSLYLISTSEITLTNLYNDCIISAKDLPICLTAQTPCFRKEAGSAGRDTRGIIREHQFDKVELVAITHPSQSDAMQELMLRTASKILSDLELPHRFMRLCSGDLGFSASNTIDIEVWLPGQGCYREISSVSNTRDFQARRAKIRYKENGKNHFAHTLNGSSLAVGRTLVAIMENYQQKDGSIAIPKVLEPYL